MYNCVVAHYDELSLKGDNRPFFIKKLYQNLSFFLNKLEKILLLKINLEKEYGLVIVMCDEAAVIEVANVLQKIPGLTNISPALRISKDLSAIKDNCLQMMANFKGVGFRVSCKRSDKSFPLTSMELDKQLGGFILEKYPQLKVKLKEFDLELNVEITDKNVYIYTQIFKGVGGLPVGSAGTLISLISGGIDSPVASFMMMKRGAKVVFCHFMNQTLQSGAVGDKINQLVKVLAQYQGPSKLYIVPFANLQKNIIAHISSPYRMLIYRRFMMRIAGVIAAKEKAKGLITGDSLSQVASQTLENLNVVHEAASMFVCSPLIGFNKLETMNLAKKIGTFDISILPYQDCCSLLISNHPQTRAAQTDIKQMEISLDIDNLVALALQEATVIEKIC